MALGPADRRLLGLATWLIVPQVICLAANEAVVSFGFVLGLLGGSPAAAIPFAAAVLVLNFLVYPRTEEILLRLQVWADVG
ncbi:MAG: hypothetical protein Q8R92_00555 [Deltaproteobacteria bacterium]|nr:hypothetical protein [Deltaproteobacteria bacterium]